MATAAAGGEGGEAAAAASSPELRAQATWRRKLLRRLGWLMLRPVGASEQQQALGFVSFFLLGSLEPPRYYITPLEAQTQAQAALQAEVPVGVQLIPKKSTATRICIGLGPIFRSVTTEYRAQTSKVDGSAVIPKVSYSLPPLGARHCPVVRLGRRQVSGRG